MAKQTASFFALFPECQFQENAKLTTENCQGFIKEANTENAVHERTVNTLNLLAQQP